ncbi:hypothetical protein [Staphylothermus hellenicus]|uniref:Uncharacterized protein n=1 Tax=Staphylothermus hellenicus (strain DSM 12710 / JCM 10830 / BK20S6-10-b1 / P8) TaxID=591019 RepID=D7DAZ9_STAHD|nr:hypothetical protein [Staphylothermus hellenicus]ADI31346.1 hypothetical protein Shell_0205 [Staphylothermus hellenicus DSM 12710]
MIDLQYLRILFEKFVSPEKYLVKKIRMSKGRNKSLNTLMKIFLNAPPIQNIFLNIVSLPSHINFDRLFTVDFFQLPNNDRYENIINEIIRDGPLIGYWLEPINNNNVNLKKSGKKRVLKKVYPPILSNLLSDSCWYRVIEESSGDKESEKLIGYAMISVIAIDKTVRYKSKKTRNTWKPETIRGEAIFILLLGSEKLLELKLALI